MNLSIWLAYTKRGCKRHRDHCHQTRRICYTIATSSTRIFEEQTRWYTTINFGMIKDDTPRMKFNSMIIGSIEMELIEVYDTTIITLWNDRIIIDCNCTKYWPVIERVYVVGIWKGYIKSIKPELYICYCKSRWMIAKYLWHDTPQLGIYNHLHIPQYIDCSWLWAINRIQYCIYAFDI